MSIIIYNREGGPIVQGCLNGMKSGLSKVGVEYEVLNESEYRPSDIAIIFGIYKKKGKNHLDRKFIIETQRSMGKDIIIMERGYINRDAYHSVGWNGLNGNANFCNINMPNDRLKMLNIDIKPWRTSGKHILLCGQVPWDSQLRHLNGSRKKGRGYLEWCNSILTLIRNYTNRKIVFRIHPEISETHPELFSFVKNFKNISISRNKSIFKDLEKCHAVVCYNSNSAVDAAIMGIPIFTCDPSAIAWEVSNKRIKRIEDPRKIPREQWLRNIAYAQWSLKEISEGLPWLHLNGGV
mgnify:CR=1 FL=1